MLHYDTFSEIFHFTPLCIPLYHNKKEHTDEKAFLTTT